LSRFFDLPGAAGRGECMGEAPMPRELGSELRPESNAGENSIDMAEPLSVRPLGTPLNGLLTEFYPNKIGRYKANPALASDAKLN
jgi:hypothetical protein